VTRLRFLAHVNPATPEFDAIDENVDVTFVPLEDVWPRPGWSPSRRRPRGEVSSGYTRFRDGDILVPKITPTFEAGRSVIADDLETPVAAGTTELHVVRSERSDARYLNYCFQTKPFLNGGEAAMVGVAGQKRVPEMWLLDYEVPVDDLRLQREIADFLEAETVRINALIEKKRRMIELLTEVWTSDLSAALNPKSGLRLKHLLAAPLAYGVLVPEHDETGVPMLRITDLREGVVDLDSVVRIPRRQSEEYRRTIVRAGDLIVSVVGTLGRSVEVGQELDGCNLNRALARVQLQHDVPRSLIQSYFESQLFLDQARLATSSDSAQPTLGLGDMKHFLVGLPTDRSSWSAIADRLRSRRARIDSATAALRRQVELLREHRQALITAAVRGDLDTAKVGV
jgi:type I restriction enzyme S subunit